MEKLYGVHKFDLFIADYELRVVEFTVTGVRLWLILIYTLFATSGFA